MDWRTASSNSMGPGMSRVECGAWEDILAVVSDFCCVVVVVVVVEKEWVKGL